MTIKILVIGTGSIGARHISNLQSLGVEVSVFSYRASKLGLVNSIPENVKLVKDLDAVLCEDYDAVVIANRTHEHMKVALNAARNKKNLFIEKPISISLDGCDELQELVNNHDLVVETGFMLRFHPNLIWIKKCVQDNVIGEVMHIRASVGQWLPDWRPDTDYKAGYGASRSTGGGVILDLIHELGLVNWFAGKVADVSAMTRYVDSLDIETEAIAQICLRLESGVLAQVHLDYIRPGYGRELEIVGSKGVLSWNYTSGTVSLSNSDVSNKVVHRVPFSFERNTMYKDHMNYFLNRLSNPKLKPASSIEDSIHALQVALACHRSSEERCCIRPSEINKDYLIKG